MRTGWSDAEVPRGGHGFQMTAIMAAVDSLVAVVLRYTLLAVLVVFPQEVSVARHTFLSCSHCSGNIAPHREGMCSRERTVYCTQVAQPPAHTVVVRHY